MLSVNFPSTDLLHTTIGRIVMIKLRGGQVLKGKLLESDQYMNLLVGDSVELVKEQEQEQEQEQEEEEKKHEKKHSDNANYLGTVLIRADNVLVIAVEHSC